MRLERLRNDGAFAFMPELEPVWGAISLLSGEPVHKLCTEIYGTEQIAAWKRKYNFLFEIYAIVTKQFNVNMLDYLLEMSLENITLAHLQEKVLAESPVEFVWRQLSLDHFCKEANKETLEKAMTDDAALDKAYSWVADYCESFLAFSAFVRQSRRLISEFFSLACDMNTPKLSAALERQASKIERMYQTVSQGSKDNDLLLLSQELMGKTFRNRGPYSEFVFLPSYLMPMRACRFFDVHGDHKRQILFLTLRQISHDREDKVRALKAIADPTRYQILMLLAEEGPMRGMDIAKKVSVATSTISHHMEQMKECGLVTEEPVKNAKYYGLSKQSMNTLLAEIASDFEIE